MPLHTQAGDTTAVATSPLSLTSTPSPREPLDDATEHHPIPLDGRSPDTGLDPASVRGDLTGLGAGLRELFANDATQDLFEWLLAPSNVLDEGGVDKGLVVATASGMNLSLEPLKYGVVEADGDAGLAGGEKIDRASLRPAEVILSLHG